MGPGSPWWWTTTAKGSDVAEHALFGHIPTYPKWKSLSRGFPFGTLRAYRASPRTSEHSAMDATNALFAVVSPSAGPLAGSRRLLVNIKSNLKQESRILRCDLGWMA